MAAQGGAPSLPSQVRRQVMAFRLVELTHVAERLGLRKTGRKGELQARILGYFGELDPAATAALGRSAVPAETQQWKLEQSAKMVNDVYCRMLGQPTSSPLSDQSAHSSLQMHGNRAATGGQVPRQVPQQHWQQGAQPPPPSQQYGAAGTNGGPARRPTYAASRLGMRVRCVCNSQSAPGRMVVCEGKGCGVWQHMDCLGLGSKDGGSLFLCELCRSRLADPFWEATETVLPAARLKSEAGRAPMYLSGREVPVQSGDRVFYLNQQQLEAVQRDPANHRVQVGCLLVDDEVLQRYHWPRNVDLKVNSLPHRPYGRGHSFKLGINQRDDVANISQLVVRGRNSLTLSAADEGVWVTTLQLARRRSLSEVKALMAAPESLDQAVARVRRQVGSGDAQDSDDELLVSHQVVSLKDPMSGQRMEVPARFADASRLQAFDLDSFLGMVERHRKWQDPATLANSTVERLQLDSYMQRVLACLREAPSVSDIEISAEGLWRPEGSSCKWLDVAADPGEVGGWLAASRAAGDAVEAEPSAAATGGGTAGQATVVRDFSDSEEEDEGEELRKAAYAVRQASSAALNALKRKAEAEVIDLLSSDDDEPPPPRGAPPQQQQQAPQQQQAAQQPSSQQPSQQPLRIRLPVRPRPGPGPPAEGGFPLQQGAPPQGAPPQGAPPPFQLPTHAGAAAHARPMGLMMGMPFAGMAPPFGAPVMAPHPAGLPPFPGGGPYPGFQLASGMLGGIDGELSSYEDFLRPFEPDGGLDLSAAAAPPAASPRAPWQQPAGQQQAQAGQRAQAGQQQELGASDLGLYQAWSPDDNLRALFQDDY